MDWDLLKGIKSADEKVVSETLQELRIKGNIEHLPLIFELYFSGRMDSLHEEIIAFLNDIKAPGAVPVFMEAIRSYRGQKGFEHLVSACWQCGLNFSEYIDQFINLVIEEEYMVSVEAFTVVEENIDNLTSQQRTARLEFVRARMENLSGDKQHLVNELLSVLSNYSGPFRLDPDHLN